MTPLLRALLPPEARRRLRALAPRGDDALPLGGYARAKRIWDSLPRDLPDETRLVFTKGILRMIAWPGDIYRA